MIAHLALGVALSFIGNRTWGQAGPIASHALGASLVAMGLWLEHAYPLWALPAIFLLIVFFRMWSVHPWFAVFQTHKWGGAFIRALAVLPLAVFLAYAQHCLGLARWWSPFVLGFLIIGAVPFLYWAAARLAIAFNSRFAAKGWQIETVALAELLVGTDIGIMGV